MANESAKDSVLGYQNPDLHRRRLKPAYIESWIFRIALLSGAMYLFYQAGQQANRPGTVQTSYDPNYPASIASDNTPGLASFGYSIGGAASVLGAALMRFEHRR